MKRILLFAVFLMMIIGMQPVFSADNTELHKSAGNSEYIEMLHEYAPVIWYSKAETYWPTSIEEMHRCSRIVNNTVRYTEPLKKLRGTLSKARTFAFFCQTDENTMKLVYRQYYMFDPGKGMILCHYGDWEGCKIIFNKEDGEWIPTVFSYNHHGIKTEVEWDSSGLKKNGNHPIIYAARGSHGIYLSAGIHRYKACLLDSTNRGTSWSTGKSLECYYYNKSDGLKSIWGADHTDEFTTITKWGQSSNSPGMSNVGYLD